MWNISKATMMFIWDRCDMYRTMQADIIHTRLCIQNHATIIMASFVSINAHSKMNKTLDENRLRFVTIHLHSSNYILS